MLDRNARVLGLALAAMLGGCAGNGTSEPGAYLSQSKPLPVAVACQPIASDQIADPYQRAGLSGWSCQTPGADYSLRLITDANITWPVAVGGGQRIEMEQTVLDGSDALGGGLFYVNQHEDVIEWVRLSTGRVVGAIYSVTGSEPATGAPATGHVAVAFSPKPAIILMSRDRNLAYQAFQMQ